MFDSFTFSLWQFWLLIAVIGLIFELSTGGFFIICFSVGAVITLFASLLGLSLTWQIVLFAVTSSLCLFFVRPFMKKYFHGGRRDDGKISNADAILGRVGVVSQTIEENGFGRVAIDGDDWKAVAVDGHEIKEGMKVSIVGRESIIITVKSIENE